MEELGSLTKWLWAMTAVAQVSLLCLLVARKNAHSYPAFAVYIFMTLAQSGLLFVAIRGWGFSSSVSWRIGWATQLLVLGARAFAVAELCRHILGPFRGVWVLARWILLACGLTVLVYALTVADHQMRLALNTAELGIELATAAIIVTLLLFARYYEVPVNQPLRALAIGLSLYSCVSVMNDAILERWLSQYVSVWNLIGMVAFFGCVLVWTSAFRKPVSQPMSAPLFADDSTYLAIVPEVNWRLHALNEQLMQFWYRESSQT